MRPRFLLFALLLLPMLPSEAACPDVGCHTYYGLFGDECICVLNGYLDMNGSPTRCQVWTRTHWVTIEHGYPPIPMEICGCTLYNPCTSGPI